MKQKEILKKIRENNNLKEVYSDSQYKMIDELMALVEEIKTLNIVEQSVAYLLPHAIDKLCAILELDTKIKTQEKIIKKLTSEIKEIRSEEEFELLFSEDGIPIFQHKHIINILFIQGGQAYVYENYNIYINAIC